MLLVSDFFPPTPGGMEAHVQRLARALLLRGHDVAIVSGTTNPEGVDDCAVVLTAATGLGRLPYIFQDGARIYAPPWPDPVFRSTVRKLAASWKPDIIHAHGWCAFSCYWPGSPPLVVTLHDHGTRCPKKTLLKEGKECVTGHGRPCLTCKGSQSAIKTIPLAAALARSVPGLAAHTSRFIAVSRSVAQRAGEVAITMPSIDVIPNFIDIEDVPVPSCTDPRGVLFVGPDSSHKGRSVVLEAWQRMTPSSSELLLVGAGAPVNMAGVKNMGYLREPELSRQYEAAVVVVVPSVWPEPCPTVVLEAMAHGKPVVGSRTGGIPDLVKHGCNGLLVTPNDPTDLANSLSRILTDCELRTSLSKGALARAAEFGTSAVVPRIEDVYMDVTGKKVPHAS